MDQSYVSQMCRYHACIHGVARVSKIRTDETKNILAFLFSSQNKTLVQDAKEKRKKGLNPGQLVRLSSCRTVLLTKPVGYETCAYVPHLTGQWYKGE